MKRHNLTKRITDNAKAFRAEVNIEIIDNYFHHLQETLNDIPPSNIFNYHRTNVTNDVVAQTVKSFVFITFIGLESLHLWLLKFRQWQMYYMKCVVCFQVLSS